jgi:DHA2 family multidrug resistance protein-like MFS transporter
MAATAQDTLGGAIDIVGQLSETAGPLLLLASREAFVDGLQLVSVCSAVITIGLAIAAAVWVGQQHDASQNDSASKPPAREPRVLAASCPAE